ncbi:MAG: HAMP domain-containing sensor histidine kinase [Clostridiales bacterium]
MFFGIRKRLVGTYLLIIFLTVTFCETAIILSVKNYYENRVDRTIEDYTSTAANFYNGYLSSTNIESNSGKLISNFLNLPVQIQIINTKGKVIADSLHVTYGTTVSTPDVEMALNGKKGKFIGRESEANEKILSHTAPLKSNNKIVGVVRFITSLEIMQNNINSIVKYLILSGLIIIFIIFIISLYISNTITRPIQEVTVVSNKMARGELSVRAKKIYNDEIGLLADSLNHMAQEIEKSENLKNDFISSISHELRTPLTSIKGWIHTLMKTGPEETKILDRGMFIINNEADRLSDMVNELLDFSRLKSMEFSLSLKEVDINKLVLRVYDQMFPRAKRQGIEFKLDFPHEKECFLIIDERRILQVFINIIDNSLKFTPNGGQIIIKTSIENQSGKKYYVVSITDSGRGIAKEDLPMIKNKFFRGRNTSDVSGIGIGLAISSELILSHEGFFDIKSCLNKGCEVIFKLPFWRKENILG